MAISNLMRNYVAEMWCYRRIMSIPWTDKLQFSLSLLDKLRKENNLNETNSQTELITCIRKKKSLYLDMSCEVENLNFSLQW